MKKLFYILIFIFTIFHISAQENRTFDAAGNNTNNPKWGTKDYFFMTMTSNGYQDSIKALSGAQRPNARMISNLIFEQSQSIEDELQLTDFNWVFGQFIDHDITLVGVDYSERIFVTVPNGDNYFTPGSRIPIFRTIAAPETGTGIDNPRKFNNEITSFIDASNIYGSNKERADWLRTFKDGKLKVSEGNLLPWNTLSGEFNDKIDPNTPELANDPGINSKLFVSGDVRACENPLLTSLHTLFMREHNRLCNQIKSQNPNWDDEKIYQKARKKVGAYLQSIVYNEWLPIQGINLPEYSGYNPNLNPGVSNLFSAAAFRLGHTLLSDVLTRIDDEGEVLKQGNIKLKDAYFNPLLVKISGGIEPFIIGMTVQIEQKLDTKMVTGVRSYLFGDPDHGGLDLASINIMRSRERGIPDYNTIRQDFGLQKLTDFNEITNDEELVKKLKFLYGNINNIDAWVGLLAEDHVKNSIFGSTLYKIMEDQFIRLRDGDRFYFENDPAFSPEEIKEIKNIKLRDLILRNTSITSIPYEVFSKRKDFHIGGPLITHSQLKAIAYPNPVKTTLTVKTWVKQDSEIKITLYDPHGRKILTQNQKVIEGENFLDIINLSHYSNGIYNLVLEIENDYNVLKIIKNE